MENIKRLAKRNAEETKAQIINVNLPPGGCRLRPRAAHEAPALIKVHKGGSLVFMSKRLLYHNSFAIASAAMIKPAQ